MGSIAAVSTQECQKTCFNPNFSSAALNNMDLDDIRAPVLWRRPHAKIYNYNQEVGGSYYQPMIEYVEAKDRQGIFFTPPEEKITLPTTGEWCLRKPPTREDKSIGRFQLEKCLVHAYSQQTKEVNSSTARVKAKMLNSVTSMKHLPHAPLNNQQTHYDDLRLLKGYKPSRKAISFYSSELNVLKNSHGFSEKCRSQHVLNASQGNFDLDHNFSGMGGVSADQIFFDPERVKNYTGAIRFKDPERTVAAVA